MFHSHKNSLPTKTILRTVLTDSLRTVLRKQTIYIFSTNYSTKKNPATNKQTKQPGCGTLVDKDVKNARFSL